jgi:hypothetical protein
VAALGARTRAAAPTLVAPAHQGLHQQPRVQLLPGLELEEGLALRGGGGEGGEVLVRAAATGGLGAAAQKVHAGGR